MSAAPLSMIDAMPVGKVFCQIMQQTSLSMSVRKRQKRSSLTQLKSVLCFTVSKVK
jgi:hypothetical protein